MVRDIIKIDEELCNGCGLCVKGCHEGALQMIDGKARMISELYCDGLGACIGDCPVGAITIEKREALPYDEIAVMERIVPLGERTIIAHLKHLKEHNETGYLKQGVMYLKSRNIEIDLSEVKSAGQKSSCTCPGSASQSFVQTKPSAAKPSFGGLSFNSTPSAAKDVASMHAGGSQLTHWPVQLHLLNPEVSHFNKADVLLAADCVAFAYAGFHTDMLTGRKLAIACPKLDVNQDVYVNKLVSMIDNSLINTLTVAIMEVPCCGGLLRLAQLAVSKAARKVPLKKIVVSVRGEVVNEEWV